MRLQNQSVIEYLRGRFRNPECKRLCEKKFGNISVEVCYDWFKIYFHKNCIVSFSDISHDVIFDNCGWETSSTSQNLRDYIEGLFGFEKLPARRGIRDEYGHTYSWDKGRIYIQPVLEIRL